MRKLVLLAVVTFFSGVWAIPAGAYTHPCIPTTLEELDTIKASLDKQPWKQGYAMLAASGHSQLTYTMQGPFANVSRKGAYDANLGAWQSDMSAVYNLARMWYFTGNEAYAQKARDILIAWANTHTSFSGNESGLTLGDYALCYGGGASILRGTWSGWTAADTTAVKHYFSSVLWPGSLAGYNVLGPTNKGAIYMEAGIAIAVFCDDAAKFDHVMNMFRTFHGSGLMGTLPTGQMGETGRDAGHAFGTLNALTFVAEVAWKQGVDLYSELDNRLLACGEYYARNTFTTDNPYVPFGTIDWPWFNNAPGAYTANRGAFYLLQNAYKNRKNLPTSWIDRKLQEQNVDAGNFMYAKTADFTTATAAPASFPAVSLASSGLTLTTLGSQSAGRSATYLNGVWTLTGLGNGVWSDTTDDCQFAYKQMTGDCAMVAKVNSFTNSGTQVGKSGLMIRDNLSSTISQRALVDVSWTPSGGNAMESHMRGWTENWGGTGYDDRSHDWTPGVPYWVKIERRGKQITTFASPDGTSWMPLNCTYYNNLPSTLYIGLFLCSGTTTAQTATFSNVAFTGGAGGLVTTPAAPAGLIATASSKAVTVRWLPSFGATAYELLRSTSVGSGYTVLAGNLTGTSYVDTTAAADTNYYYRVRAKNSAGTSGDSSTFGGSHGLLVPQWANLAFSGTTTASINVGPQVGGSDDAFNGDPGSKWYGYNSPTGWLQYDFGAGNAQVVKRYTINCADVANRDPKSWNFLGSQDGVSWTTLDSQSNQSFVIRMGMNTYNLANTTAYRYYRLDITANNGATGVAVADLGLWSDTGRTIPDGTYRLVSRKSNKVMDVTGGSTTDGAPLVQGGWHGTDSQQWDLAYLGNGQYKLTGVASNKLLEVMSASTSNGAVVQIWPSTNNNGQKWTVIPAGDGTFKLLNVNSGKAVDVSGGSTADGAAVIQWPDSGAVNQRWMFSIGVAPQPIPPPPTGLAATTVSLGQVNLTWTASPGAINYNIKRATVSGGPYTTVVTGVNTTNYSNTGLLSSTTYYYVVSAVNGSGESADSSEISAIPNALVAHLKFDENSGSSAVDSSNNNRHGTAFNAPLWTTGRIGNALSLNGTNQYVNLPSSVASSLQNFTIATWVYWNGGNNWQRIFDFGSGTSTYMFLSPKNGANGKLRFAITTSGAAGEQKIDGNAVLPTGWHHVAITLSDSTGTLYVDGQQAGQNTAMTLRPSDLGATTQNRIGRSQYNDPYFNGRIDDFRMYAGTLGSSQIAALAAPMQTTGLAATSGDGQIALDWSPTPGAAHYTVRRASTSGGASTAIASGITGTSYTDISTANGTAYYYVVTPVNASGDGANSDEMEGLALTPLQHWRLTNFGTFANSGNAADAADPDADGWTNAAEFSAGTDPSDRASSLKVTSMQPNGNDMDLSFPTVSGKFYRLEQSATLLDNSWTTVEANIEGTGSPIQITDTGGANQSKRFYRIVVMP